MTNAPNLQPREAVPQNRRLTLTLSAIIGLGLASTVLLGHWMGINRPSFNLSHGDASLYLKATTAKRISLGFNGLVADWYWMRALQYVGRKVLAHPEGLALASLSQLDLQQLAPLLEHVTTLDPQFMPAYEYGSMLLPEIDVEAAIRLTKKGIEANAQEWRLYHYLGYTYWQQGRFREASETYQRGATLGEAPPWMRAMAAQMELKSGQREVAREIYTRIYEEAGNQMVKEMAYQRLRQLRSLDERDEIRRVIAGYRERLGRCPRAWRDLAAALRASRFIIDASGAPLDPSGTAYVLAADGCEVDLNRAATEIHDH